MINRHQVLPSGFLGSEYDPPSAHELLFMMKAWYDYSLAQIIALENYPYCPLLPTETFKESFQWTERCAQLNEGKCAEEYARQLNGWEHLKQCGFFQEKMEETLGPRWRERLVYVYEDRF